jgi:hypothetical protein
MTTHQHTNTGKKFNPNDLNKDFTPNQLQAYINSLNSIDKLQAQEYILKNFRVYCSIINIQG